jgi:hypothetical protein
MSAADRNGRIQSLLVQMVTEVRSSSAPSEPLPAARRQQIGKICSAKAQGYREVLLTVIVAWLDGIKFDPCGGDFYECKPRAIFEQGVRPGLVALGLKSRKSGPLNVAKAQTRLDASWAASRDDAVTAGLVVDILKWMMADIPRRARATLLAILEDLVEEARHLKSMTIASPTSLSAYECSRRVQELIRLAPNAGNTAQAAVHAALTELHVGSDVEIGELGRASETNFTAKKPADISVVAPWSSVPHLYEVTTKKIDDVRLRDSDESVLKFGAGANSVSWLCLLPDNVASLDIDGFECESENGVRHEFHDLRAWLSAVMEILGEARRDNFLARLSHYIDDPQTDGVVKTAWRQVQGSDFAD